LGSLSGQSIAVRSDATAPLPNVRSNNVLILNTAGELLKMYALANIAIVGNDRNIFEPASQQAAVLYFEGGWQNNREAKDALVEVGAAKIFSKENLERSISVSDETAEMAKNGTRAVETYRREVEYKAEEFVLQIIGAKPQLRSKFITSSTHDMAQLTKSEKGGIDLTPANMNLQTRNNGGEIKFHIDPAMLEQLQNAPGFVPVIINVQPLNSLQEFLGLNTSPMNRQNHKWI